MAVGGAARRRVNRALSGGGIAGGPPRNARLPQHQKRNNDQLHDQAEPVAEAGWADAARALMLARQGRGAIFASAMFGEPAWDMLIALYLAEFDQVRITVTGLAERSGAALTTAIRWLDYLEQTQLVERRAHPTDRRVIFVELSEDARSKLRTYFRALVEAGHVPA